MPKTIPFLWFDDQAEEAAKFYVSIFKNSKIINISRFGDAGPGPKGSAMVVQFQLDGQDVMALNGGQGRSLPASPGQFPGSIALYVNCETQADADYLWDKLSQGGEKDQCGWLTDKYGFSWNIVPEGIINFVAGPDPEKARRAMEAMMQMKKLDVNEVRNAYEGT